MADIAHTFRSEGETAQTATVALEPWLLSAQQQLGRWRAALGAESLLLLLRQARAPIPSPTRAAAEQLV
jgi:hypothetical protein